MLSNETIGARLTATKGYSSGWDYLRLILAAGVIVVHSLPLSHGIAARWAIPTPLMMFAQVLLPMFFALSGFLVAASLLRVPIPNFIGLRVLRIFPALAVEVVLSALILGPLLTPIPMTEYFSNEWFWAYFKNVYGDIHYTLPGLFMNNPYPNVVNGSLWTVPFELECYIVLVVLGILRFNRHWALMLMVTIAGSGYLWFNHAEEGIESFIYGRLLVVYFLAGVTIYSMRSFLPLRIDLFLACAILALAGTLHKELLYLSPLAVAYCTAWIGLQTPKKVPAVLFSGDYSYGIYLYGFVVQQVFAQLAPSNWIVNSILSLIAVSLFAAFSWHFIEKPTLKLKRFLKDGKHNRRDDELASGALPPTAQA